MVDNLVTIKTFTDPLEASVAKTKLDSEGIFCFIADEELMNSSFRIIVGQVRFQVKKSEVKRAKKVLKL